MLTLVCQKSLVLYPRGREVILEKLGGCAAHFPKLLPYLWPKSVALKPKTVQNQLTGNQGHNTNFIFLYLVTTDHVFWLSDSFYRPTQFEKLKHLATSVSLATFIPFLTYICQLFISILVFHLLETFKEWLKWLVMPFRMTWKQDNLEGPQFKASLDPVYCRVDYQSKHEPFWVALDIKEETWSYILYYAVQGEYTCLHVRFCLSHFQAGTGQNRYKITCKENNKNSDASKFPQV